MTDDRTVHVLLSPKATLVVDVFRALGDFEASYDVGVIDVLEHRLTNAMGGEGARAVVSDALLLGFAMRNQRDDAGSPRAGWEMNALGERRASRHECATLALICASRTGDMPLAVQAARILSVRLNPTVSSLARDMGARLAEAGLRVESRDWAPLVDTSAPSSAQGDAARDRAVARS